jgi:phage protein U
MLCDLGGFTFEVNKTEFEKLNRSLKFNFAKMERVANTGLLRDSRNYTHREDPGALCPRQP